MGNWLVAEIALTFSTGGQLFSVSELFYKKNVSLDDQTRRAKSSSQPVHLRGARPVMTPLLLVFKKKIRGGSRRRAYIRGCGTFHRGTTVLKEPLIVKSSLPLECTRIKMTAKEQVGEFCLQETLWELDSDEILQGRSSTARNHV